MNKMDLLQQASKGKTFSYEKFAEGVFSPWHKQEFRDGDNEDAKKYCCVEQYFMEKKALTFGDEETAKKIMSTFDPKIIRELGRKVKNFDEETWSMMDEEMMYWAYFHKCVDTPVGKTLLKTGDKIMVYCNPADLNWGAGIDIMDKRTQEPFEWPGENKLGFTIMKVRDALMQMMDAPRMTP